MKISFRLDGLDCAVCAAKIEKKVSAIKGVKEASVNFLTTKMVIEGDDSEMDRIVSKAESIVKKYEPDVIMKKA